MNGVSCVYVCTHGNPAYHDAGDGTDIWPQDDPETSVVEPNYESERMAATGYGLPPFNSTDKPPLTFIMICSCNVGDTPAFMTALYPHENGYGENLINQVLWAYTIFMPGGMSDNYSSNSFALLSDGETAEATRAWLYAFADDLGLEVMLDNGQIRTLAPGDIA